MFFYLSLKVPLYFTKQFKLDYMNPIIIYYGLNIGLDIFKVILGPLVLVNKGLYNEYYQHALLITNLQLLIKYFAVIVFLKFIRHNRKINTLERRLDKTLNIRYIINNRIVICICIIFMAMLLSFVLLASHSFSVIDWIKSPRTGYQKHREGAGFFYAVYLTCLSMVFTLSIIYKKNVFIDFILLISVYLLGSKGEFLNFFIGLYTVLWYKKTKNLSKYLICGLPFVAIFMLINFGSKDITAILNYFDYYKNTTMYFERYDNGLIDLYYGKLHLTNLWSIIPRSLYPNKPYVYGITYINEIFYPGQAELTNYPAFGGPLMAFADFGYIGVVLESFFDLNLFVRCLLYYYLFEKYSFENIKSNWFILACFIYLFSPSFLRYFASPLNIIVFIMIYFFCLFILRLNPCLKLLLKVNYSTSKDRKGI